MEGKYRIDFNEDTLLGNGLKAWQGGLYESQIDNKLYFSLEDSLIDADSNKQQLNINNNQSELLLSELKLYQEGFSRPGKTTWPISLRLADTDTNGFVETGNIAFVVPGNETNSDYLRTLRFTTDVIDTEENPNDFTGKVSLQKILFSNKRRINVEEEMYNLDFNDDGVIGEGIIKIYLMNSICQVRII